MQGIIQAKQVFDELSAKVLFGQDEAFTHELFRRNKVEFDSDMQEVQLVSEDWQDEHGFVQGMHEFWPDDEFIAANVPFKHEVALTQVWF